MASLVSLMTRSTYQTLGSQRLAASRTQSRRLEVDAEFGGVRLIVLPRLEDLVLGRPGNGTLSRA
jgi:hypothetical protein